jgi:putative transposase
MLNHFHLVIETPEPNLVSGMKWLLSTYTSRFNRRQGEFGHLFSGRYKALIVDGSGSGYLRTVCDYVHLNPVRADLLKPEEGLEAYVWSSYPGYLSGPKKRFPWLRVDRVLGEHGISRDTPAGRREFRKRMTARRYEQDEAAYQKVRRGWCLGDAEFKKELLERIEGVGGEITRILRKMKRMN